MSLDVVIAVCAVTFSGLTFWAVHTITDALNNIAAAVRGQVVKPVSLVPPSWGKRH